MPGSSIQGSPTLYRMNMAITHAFTIAIFVLGALAIDEPKRATILKYSNMRFGSQSLESFRVVSDVDCIRLCLLKLRCRSGNAVTSADGWMSCRLLDAHEEQLTELTDEPGALFFGDFRIILVFKCYLKEDLKFRYIYCDFSVKMIF